MNKEQQALNTLREKGYTNHFQSITLEQQYPNEFKILQELVDKATPKKPIRFIDKFYVSPYKCPVCKTIPHTGNQKYCDECGQALDWSDEDE